MELYCMEARALKSSLRREVMASVKCSPQQQSQSQSHHPQQPQDLGFEDFLCLNPGSADDFSVDCFFDFSNGGFKDEQEPEEEEEEQDSVSVFNSSSASFSDSFLSGNLPVHAEDLAELEWVSQIVDDSSSQSEVAAALLAVVPAEKPFEFKSPAPPVFTTLPPPPFLTSGVPARTRSKRVRTAGRSWVTGSSVISDSSSSLTSSPTSSSSAASSTPCLISISSLFPGLAGEPAKKKQRKRLPGTESGSGNPTLNQRRCSHCGIQKTPQWRSGPEGTKTLCNACGVRYKSGRLLPEYRPAGSPTFSSEVHSNSHRKVLEMRRKKEQVGDSVTAAAAGGPDLTRMVPGF